MKTKAAYLVGFFLCSGSFTRADLRDTSIQGIAAGGNTTCAYSETAIRCIGDNDYGQARLIRGFTHLKQVAVGVSHVCVIDSNGESEDVSCWGNNSFGQLEVPYLDHPFEITVGNDFTCALDSEGVKCWGGNPAGETNVPSFPGKVLKLASGARFSCAFTGVTGWNCWGLDNYASMKVPAEKKMDETINLILSAWNGCFLDAGRVGCWGDDSYAQTDVPADLKKANQIALGARYTCALIENGKIRCWGDPSGGGTEPPVGLEEVKQIAVGFAHTCALAKGEVKCWGYNGDGQTKVPADWFF